MIRLIVYILIISGVQACDSKLSVTVGNLATAPVVNTNENLDGFSSTFTPEIEVAGDDYESVVWAKQSGPGQVFFDDPTSVSPNIYADTPGDYILTVTVTSKRGVSTTTEYKFTWTNAAPANFEITSPLNSVANLKPVIAWSDATDINSVTYTLVIYQSDCSTEHQKKEGLTSGAYNLESDLTNGQSYCVSVTATDSWGASTVASNDKEVIFSVNTSTAVTVTGSFSWANEASDAYIKFGEEASTNPVAVIAGTYASAVYTSLLDETTSQTCDASQTYDQANIPLINTISIDGPYSLCAKLQDSSGSTLYIKSGSTLRRDVIVPSITTNAVLDTAGVLADSQITAAEFTAATEIISTDVVPVGADILGYAFVAAADACNTVATYKDPLRTNDTTITGNGSFKVCTKLEDLAGNEFFGPPSATFTIDRDAPAIASVSLMAEAADSYINNTENGSANAIFSFSGSGYDTVEYEIVASAHTCAVAAATAWSAAVPAANTETTEGAYKICVKVSDSMNTPAVMTSSDFTIDKTGPTIDAGSNFSANTATALSPTLGDAVSQTWSGPAQITFGAASSATSTVMASADGPYAITLTALDAAGNSSVDSLVFTWDTVGPTVNAGSDITIGSTIASAASAGGDATTFAWTQQSGPGTITFSSANTLATNISADVQGAYVIRLTVGDALGNTAWDELNFTWNTTAVTVNVGGDVSIKTGTEAAKTPAVSGEGGSPTYAWTYTGPGTLTFAPNATTKDLTGITADTEGAYTVTLTTTNTGNNNTGNDSFSLTWDVTAPSVTNVDAAGDIVGGLLSAAERSATNPLINNVTSTGQDNIEYTVTTAATACSAATGYSGTVPLSNDARITTDGNYKVCVKATDNASNTPSYDDSVTFTVDTTAPTSNTISIDAGATYDNDASVDLTLASTGAAEMKVSNSSDCSTGAYEAYNTTKNGWSLAQTNATATVYVMFKDSAGNESTCISDTIIHDNVAPTSPTISIAGGAAYATTNPVALALGATDASHMYITNTAGCAAGGTEEAYAATKASWTLGQTNATATVYVRFRDLAGNWTSCENDTIDHDDTDPTLTVTNSGWVNASNYTSYAITGACNENGASVIVGGSVAGSGTCDGSNYTANINYTSISDATNAISVTVDMDDAAGNSATQASVTLSKDIVAPAIAVTNTGWINEDTEGAYNVTGTCTDAVSGTSGITVNIAGSESATVACTASAFTVAVDYSGQADGDNNISITANIDDAAGNSATQSSITLSKDTVDPVISLTDNGHVVNGNETSYTISGTCTDDRSGVNTRTVTIAGAYSNTDTCSSGVFTESFDVSAASEGAFNLTADITDAAGNAATQATLNKVKDSILPTTPASITLSGPSVGTLRFTYTDGTDTNIGNHDTIYCTANDCSTGCSAIQSDANSPTDHTGVSSGIYYGCVRSNDTYGNRSPYAVSGSSITLDGTPPTFPSGSAITLSDTYYYTTTLMWNKAADDVSTEAQLRYSIYYSTSSSFDTVAEVEAGTAVATMQTDISTYTIKTLEPDTTYYVNVVAYDLTGNGVAYTKSQFKTEALTRVSGGLYTSCLINDEGKLYCMGAGTYGFGDGNAAQYEVPTLVDDGITAKRFKGVATSNYGGCGLSTDGEIYCWGLGNSGAIGNGTTTTTNNSPLAVTPASAQTWRYLDGSEYWNANNQEFYCAINTDGDGFCWGLNNHNQLGDNTIVSRDIPTPINGSLKWRNISAGGTHACGVTEDNDGYCWGHNAYNQLGDNTSVQKAVPTPVSGGLSWKKIAAGYINSCGITTAGAAYCWGSDNNSQLGNGGGNTASAVPTAVSGGLVFRDIEASWAHNCGITTSDVLYCWGHNGSGQIGDGTLVNKDVPTQVMTDVHSMELGYQNTCVVKNNGTSFCWGNDVYGETGHGYANQDSSYPSMVLSGEKWLKNMATDAQILETNHKNTLSWVKPANATGVIILRHSSPVTDKPVDGTTYVATNTIGSATVMYVGTGTSFADTGLTNDTTYYYAIHSYDANNQYSNGVKLFGEPTRQSNNQRIGLGQMGGCAIDHNNAPYCWGEGTYGMIGNGSTAHQSSPTAVTTSGITNSKEFVHIAVGANTYACGITKDSELWCWGHNSDGQLGQGNTTQVLSPVQVSGSWRTTSPETVGWVSNDHREHMCAINTTGDLYCTGYNVHGQIGDGTASARTSMTLVSGGLKWKSVKSGALHTCGVTMEGEGLCWGYNTSNNLGNGVTTIRYAPFSVAGDRQWKDISAGRYSSCGITHDNVGYCWGDNTTYGHLGDGTTTDRPTPVTISGSHSFRQITGGEQNRCGVTTADDLYCWGHNTYSSVGNNTDGTHQLTPQFIMGDVFQVTTGRLSSCAVRNDGKGFCWGYSAYAEELGVGWNTGEVDVPHAIYGNKTWLKYAPADFQIYPYGSRLEVSWTAPTNAAGYLVLRHTSAITDEPLDGTTYTTGGSLGSATIAYAGTGTNFSDTGLTDGTIYYYTAYAYTGGVGSEVYHSPVSQIAIPKSREHNRIGVGASSTCALTGDNKLYCWGQANGNGTASNSNIPLAMDTSLDFIEARGGTTFACALGADGKLYCWGNNDHGNLGDGSQTPSTTPVTIDGGEEVSGGHTWLSFDTGQYWDNNWYKQVCALKDNHDAYCWGQGTHGRLGDGTTTGSQTTPSLVIGGHKFIELDAGAITTCGVTTNHDAYCWGYNDYSQLGSGNTTQLNLPSAPVHGGKKWLMVSPGFRMACGIDTNNDAYCWGRNIYGSLGYGSTTTATVSTPTAVTGSHKFRYIESSDRAACAITTADDLYCWGLSDHYELGLGTNTNHGTPQEVTALGKVDQISVNAHGACAIKQSDDKIYCWGNNQFSKLGTGAAIDTNVTTPTQIATADDGATIDAPVRSPAAYFTGIPTGTTHITRTHINVAGPDVSHYLYAIGAAGSTACSSASYSTATAIGTALEADISGIADGSIRLCIRSQSAGGTTLAAANAYDFTWTKDTSAGMYVNSVDVVGGTAGNDTLTGGLGGDTIIAGDGDDTIHPDLTAAESYITYLRNNASMKLWLDGSDPLGTGTPPADGAHVATWDDKSTSTFDMPATSMPAYYSDGIGGRGAIRFDGVDDKYLIGYQPSLNATTQDVFVVTQIRGSDGSWRAPVDSRGAYTGYNFYASDDNKWELWNGTGTVYSVGESSTQPFSDVPALLELSIDTSANPNVNKFLNGTSVATSTTYSLNTTQGFAVGSLSDSAFPLNGDVGEVIIFNANLTTTQKEGLRQVLANKWGLGMSAPSSSAFSSDTMTGGAGADTFVYNQNSFSDPSNRDVITDFSIGEGDKLDLSDLSMNFAIQGALGLQSSGHAEAAWEDDSGDTLVKLDYDGDGTSELEIRLSGVDNTTLTTDHIIINGNDMNDTGADTITGTSGNDTLTGGYGGDTIDGGAGNDIIYPDGRFVDIHGMKQTTGWWDASNTFNNAAFMDLWVDRSKTGLDVTVNDINYRPGLDPSGINGMPALWFGGVNDFLYASSVTGSTLFDPELAHIYVVQTYNDTDDQQTASYGWTNGSERVLNHFANTDDKLKFDHGTCCSVGSSRIDGAQPAGFDDVPHVMSSVKRADNSANIYMDGASVLSGTMTDSLVTTGSGTFIIGDFDTTADSGYEFNGLIGEVIIFNRDLSPANKKYVDEYLSYKYKLPMDGLNFGADTLTGGTGADTFMWTNASHSGVGAGNRDTITDFNPGEGDKISLFYIDQQINLKGHGASFQTLPFTLIWSQSGADTLVQMDSDGDRTADWEILLENFTSSSLLASDFILPPEKISSSALVGHFDPAYATGSAFAGVAASNCSNLSTSYTDLSGVIGNGTLENFSSCDSGNYAWQGTGTNTDPYRLELIDGSSSRVRLSDITADFSSGFSFDGWIRTTAGADNERLFAFDVDGDNWIVGKVAPTNVSEFFVENNTVIDSLSSNTDVTGDIWTHVAYTQTGTTAKLYINGENEKSNTLSVAIPEAIRTTNFLGNNGGNALNGALGPMRFYTDDLDPREVANNFQNQADRFRSTPVGDIITDGLIFHLDPANADGMKFPGVAAADCSDLFVPQDLSTEQMAISLGAMDNCGAGNEGWQGAGTSGDPYRFHLSGGGNADRITVPHDDKFESYKITYSIWFKSNGTWGSDGSSSNDTCALLHKASSTESFDGFNLHIDPGTGLLRLEVKDGSTGNLITGTTNILDNQWHHIAIKYHRNVGQAYDIYLDGASEATGTNNMSSGATEAFIIGDSDNPWWEECQGDIGSVMVYDHWLSADEIKQNCNAQEGRYTASDDICADF